MSGIIKLLPDHIANQIAAGEVIQRPASVVKEMMENAIDAGAEKIEIIIKDAGKTLIQIVDNGKGMSADDAELCFARHATSKVSSAADLFSLKTKGFRGEALASVAAIAHVCLQTKEEGKDLGTIIQVEGSEIVSKDETVCSNGSSFEVKNLFYNVPARRNFLKSTEVEFKHIREEFERIALAHPGIHFRLFHNDQEIYNLPIAVLRKRIIDIIGKAFNERLVPIEENTDIVKIHGYVVKPEFAKKSRGDQYLFVNDRFFKENYFNHAIGKAFDGLIQPKTFPTYFLYFEVDPSKIDVNVHPTKTEIKFEEDRSIYAILVSSIKTALGKYNIMPTLDFDAETAFDIPHEMRKQPAFEPQIRVDPTYNPFKTSSTSSSYSSGSKNFTTAIKAQGFGTKEADEKDWQEFYSVTEDVHSIPQQKIDLESEDLGNQLARTKYYILRHPYIISSTKSGLMVIHASRAFERITYDLMMTEFISHPISSQQLLFPIEKEISKSEKSHWMDNASILKRLGFDFILSDLTIEISSIPAILQEETIHPCIDHLLSNIEYDSIDKGDIAHYLIQSIAFNSSRKKDLVSNQEEADHLIEQLFACSEHVFTPNGKRIIESISFDEIAAKF